MPFMMYRFHYPLCLWIRADDERIFQEELRKHMDSPLYLPEAVIKSIQVKEESDIEGLTIEELGNRIEKYQQASRELQIREYVTRKKMHGRLSALNDDDLNKIITKVPGAEGEARVRRSRSEANKPKLNKPKGRPSKLDEKLDKLKMSNPDFANFLAGLSPKKD